jgi:quercetin dioxygenase-like cupin family protein
VNQETKHPPSAAIGPVREFAQFGGEQFATSTLLADPHIRVRLVAFEFGEEIPLHAPAVDLLVVVANGIGEILAEGRLPRAGEVAVVPVGHTRGIRASSARLVLITVVTPPPGQTDHASAAGVQCGKRARRNPVRQRCFEPGTRSCVRTLTIFARSRTNSMSATSRSCGSVSSGWRRSCATAWPIRGVEETTVYPAPAKLQRFLGGAIGTMMIAHDLTAGRVAEVESLAAADRHDAPTRAELGQSLIGLEAALYGHFDEEEQVYVPLLEHLTPRESDALARQPEHAAAKGHEH